MVLTKQQTNLMVRQEIGCRHLDDSIDPASFPTRTVLLAVLILGVAIPFCVATKACLFDDPMINDTMIKINGYNHNLSFR